MSMWSFADPTTGQTVSTGLEQLMQGVRAAQGPAIVGEPKDKAVIEEEMQSKPISDAAGPGSLSIGTTPIPVAQVKGAGGRYDVWDTKGTYLGVFEPQNNGLATLFIGSETHTYRGTFHQRKGVTVGGLRRRRTQKRQPKRRQSKQEQAGKRRVRSRRNRNRQ